MRDPCSILITGASSGIGAALALEYAAPGVALALGGRNEARLAAVADACRARGAAVQSAGIDVRAAMEMRDWINVMDRNRPLDLVVANAGVSAGTAGGDESDAQVRHLFAVNLEGVFNTVHPAIGAMRPRRHGQIAIMSSLAGFRGLPGAPAYSAAKAAARVYGEGLRPLLRRDGITVSVICPGFVESRMTQGNDFPMPFRMDAPRAARIIRRGLSRGRARIAFPWPMAALVRLLAAPPPGWLDPLLARLPAKR